MYDMYERLLKLLGDCLSTSFCTQKGEGMVSLYLVPRGNVEEVMELLGVKLHAPNWERCRNSNKGYKSHVHVEVFVPEKGRRTAQLYGIPWDQTVDRFLYISTEVVLN